MDNIQQNQPWLISKMHNINLGCIRPSTMLSTHGTSVEVKKRLPTYGLIQKLRLTK